MFLFESVQVSADNPPAAIGRKTLMETHDVAIWLQQMVNLPV